MRRNKNNRRAKKIKELTMYYMQTTDNVILARRRAINRYKWLQDVNKMKCHRNKTDIVLYK